MSTDTGQPRGAHLVGSFPFASSDEVFRMSAAILGNHLRRMPDGETGVRNGWIRWQGAVFASHPAFEPGPVEPGIYGPGPTLRLRDRDRAAGVEFGALGYAAAAEASYRQFAQFQREGVIPSRIRFQVSLPTPLAPLTSFALADRSLVEPAYERRMLAELQEMATAIPHDQLAIQWDVAVEVALLEGVAPTHLRDPWDGIVERLARLGQAVPPDVELGYHFCYGYARRRHFMEPADTGLVVRLANAVAARLTRPLTWVHLPVPRDRDDDGYFAPLEGLQLPADTEIYLGLVHYHDGVRGTERRIEAARRRLPRFGVGTECGMGPRPADVVPELLRTHAAVAAPVR
jgi:hypothetical protein